VITITWSWLSFWAGFGSVFLLLSIALTAIAIRGIVKAANAKKYKDSNLESLEDLLARWPKQEG
jgi:hypothetical protein